MTAISAIIPASGVGRRLTNCAGKTFIPLAGKPLIAHTLSVFQECPQVDEIVLVTREDSISAAQSLVADYALTKVTAIVPGGAERQDSVRNGLRAVSPESEIVAIHDGARPLVTPQIIADSIEAARIHGAAIAAVPVIDTIKSSSDGVLVRQTLDRKCLYATQTPQTFRLPLIIEACERAYTDGFIGTDDASLVERLGFPVAIAPGSYENIKVTTPTDLVLAESILQARLGVDTLTRQTSPTPCPSWRVGHGYDVHRFSPGRRLVLGGVEFPGEEGLLGHSDADVLLHAVSDALLGAAGMGDIGKLFPDTDESFKDADSLVLLRGVGEIVSGRGWCVANVDVSLVAQKPRVSKHTVKMAENIAGALKISRAQVNIKATTAEGLGDIGAGLGIECHAVALLYEE